MAGRKPKPSYLRVLDGRPGTRGQNPDEPIPTGPIGEPPPELPANQQKLWRDTVASLPPGAITSADASVLRVYVVALDTMEIARQHVADHGLVVTMPSGAMIQNPYLPIQNRQANIAMRAAVEMGLTPSSRSKVRMPKSATAQNPFGALKRLGD